MKNSFYLVIPPQKSDSERIKAFEPQPLEQWIQDLPKANFGLTTRLFHDLLIELNTLKIKPEHRISILENLRPTYYSILDCLNSRLISPGIPKEENDKKVWDVLISMQKEFSMGYWCIVRELTRKGAGWFKGKSSALALARLINGLGDILISHYLLYIPAPSWVWLDIHSLYKLSVTQKKETTKVPDPASHRKITTIQQNYFKILLLYIADPHGLIQREIVLINRILDDYVSFVEIEDNDVDLQLNQCAVFLEEDKAPIWSERNKYTCKDGSIKFINFTKLSKAFLKREKTSVKSSSRFGTLNTNTGFEKSMPYDLYQYLQARWDGILLTGDQAFADRLNQYLLVGLETSHHYLKGHENQSDDLKQEQWAETSSERALTLKSSGKQKLSIGSLVTFRREDKAVFIRSLGLITKLSMNGPNGKIKFELHKIANRVFPADLLPVGAKEDVVPQKSLIYSAQLANGTRKSFLILETVFSNEGDIIRVFLENDDFSVVLMNRKNIGLGYWQFECRKIVEKNETQQETKGYDFI